MANPFQQGQQFAQERTKRKRVEEGVQALAGEFGTQALAPSEFAIVRGSERADVTAKAREEQRGILNQRADVTAADIEEDRVRADQLQASRALVNFYKQGIKSGVPVEDITGRAAPVLQALGVNPADFADLNAQITENPAMLDQIAAALKGQGKQRTGAGIRQRPIEVVGAGGDVTFFAMDQDTGEFVDTGLVSAKRVEGGRRLDIAEDTLETKQPVFKGTVEEEKAVGAKRGEIRAGDLTPGQRAIAQSKLKLEVDQERNQLLQGTINKAIGQAGVMTAGFASLLSAVPGTPAANLAATLDTIQATIGFDELQRLRDNSETGGALGQVSNIENLLLQAVWGNVQESQSPPQLRENLKALGVAIERKNRRIAEAWKIDFGTDYTGEGTAIPVGGDIEDLLNQFAPIENGGGQATVGKPVPKL